MKWRLLMAVSYNTIDWVACYEYNTGNNFGEGLNRGNCPGIPVIVAIDKITIFKPK